MFFDDEDDAAADGGMADTPAAPTDSDGEDDKGEGMGGAM